MVINDRRAGLPIVIVRITRACAGVAADQHAMASLNELICSRGKQRDAKLLLLYFFRHPDHHAAIIRSLHSGGEAPLGRGAENTLLASGPLFQSVNLFLSKNGENEFRHPGLRGQGLRFIERKANQTLRFRAGLV